MNLSDFEIENGVLKKYHGTGGAAVIPAGVSCIGEYAFHNCTNLTHVHIPDSVTSIENVAFRDCSSLTNVTIPDSVTSIGSSAFAVCSSLTNVTIPDSVTSIGKSAFARCSGLTNVTIPDSVTSIENVAFRDCSSLTNVTIPDSVTSIGSSAFAVCSSLTNVTIPDSVTSIEVFAFEGCSSLKTVTYHGITFVPDIPAYISLNSIFDLIDNKDYESYPPKEYPFMYGIIWSIFRANPDDEKTFAYIKENFGEMFRALIDEEDPAMIQYFFDHTDFVTNDNIDGFIQCAIVHQKYHSQVLLTNFKAEKIGYENPEEAIRKKFSL